MKDFFVWLMDELKEALLTILEYVVGFIVDYGRFWWELVTSVFGPVVTATINALGLQAHWNAFMASFNNLIGPAVAAYPEITTVWEATMTMFALVTTWLITRWIIKLAPFVGGG